MRCLHSITDAMDMNLGKLRDMVRDGDRETSHMCCGPGGRKESDMTEQQNSNRMPTKYLFIVHIHLC